MKQNFYFKSLLIALFVLFGGGSVFAQQTQTYFSCNFDNYTNTSNLTSNGWAQSGTINMNSNTPYCSSGRAVQLGTKNGASGAVTTPIISTNLPSNVDLSFYTGTGGYNDITLTVTILNGGAFLNADNTTSESIEIAVTKNGGKTYTYSLTGCTSETKIKFSANKIAGLDNVIVKGEADSRTPVTLSYGTDKFKTATESGVIADAPTLTVTPSEASSEVVFSSSNTDVATVDANGVVTAVAPGQAVITASISGSETYRDVKDEYTLTVGLASSNLSYNPTSVTVTYGGNFTMPDLSYAKGYDKTAITMAAGIPFPHTSPIHSRQARLPSHLQ